DPHTGDRAHGTSGKRNGRRPGEPGAPAHMPFFANSMKPWMASEVTTPSSVMVWPAVFDVMLSTTLTKGANSLLLSACTLTSGLKVFSAAGSALYFSAVFFLPADLARATTTGSFRWAKKKVLRSSTAPKPDPDGPEPLNS